MLEIVACLVVLEGCDINQMDCMENTALIWAGGKEHEGAVQILGRDDANPTKQIMMGKHRCTRLFGVDTKEWWK